jgi:TPR repeat protein
LILGACISAAVAAGAIEYSDYHHENVRLGKAKAELSVQKGSEEASKAGLMNPSPSSTSPNGTSANVHGSSDQKIHAAEVFTPVAAAGEASGHTSNRNWEAKASNPPARTPLQQNLGGNASRQKPAMTPQQLWASVQAGNSKAAVALADLYIKGQGVAQNCNQARVLLLVASEKRDAEAIRKLADLDKTACPSN